MISTIDWNLMAFWANLCVLGSKVGKITLMKGMQHHSAQSCQLWKFTNMWINILGFLILTYTSAYITFLINKTFHIKQFCITTRGVCSCDVYYLVSEKFLSYLLFTCLFSLFVFTKSTMSLFSKCTPSLASRIHFLLVTLTALYKSEQPTQKWAPNYYFDPIFCPLIIYSRNI